MLQLTCPHCDETFGLFSKVWQAQRQGGRSRECPFCRKHVFPKFQATRFLGALAMVLVPGALLTYAVGPVGFVATSLGVCTAPILLSIYLDSEA
jgi:hypothetical protein